MRFIDLFAGLGGFHVALDRLNCRCVFACEINPILQEVYKKNFSILPKGDIKNVDINKIPKHDILCAGFPCQPFSKAGERREGNDERGRLLHNVEDILMNKKPKFFILENVLRFKQSNLLTELKEKLLNIYNIQTIDISPDDVGIPQHRPRIFIIGQKLGNKYIKNIEDIKLQKIDNPLLSFSLKKKDVVYVDEKKVKILKLWQNIIDSLSSDEEIYSPLWTTEYQATYPFEKQTPCSYSTERLSKYNGKYGISLSNLNREEQLKLLPKYAISNDSIFPKWKVNFIKKNREYCLRQKDNLEKYIDELKTLPLSHQKLEWNVKGLDRNLKKHLIQFRPSGIRVSNKKRFPSLVSINLTQTPIICDDNKYRYLTVKEASSLQAFPPGFILPDDHSKSFQALGNAVNTEIVYQIAKLLLS